MSALLMVGAQPDNDNSMTSRNYSDQRQLLTSVTQSQTDSELTLQLTDRATKAYVDQQDALKVAKTYVDSQDAKLALKTTLGAASGISKLDANLLVPVSQLQNAPRGWASGYSASFGSSFSTSSTSRRQLGTVFLADPGYKWTPLIFGGGFETYVTSANARGDILVTMGSLNGTSVGYGTGKLGVNDSYRGHIEVLTDQAAGTYTGSTTFYLSAFRGFGSGTISFYPDLAWCSIFAMPVV